MPQQDADKDTNVLLGEIKTGVPGNLLAVHAKIDELIFREIKNGDADDITLGGVKTTEKGTRPKHAPHV